MIFVTADTHFGHANIIRYANRPFRDVFEMDAEIVRRWNAVVKPGDTVYHIGDFCFRQEDDYLPILNGKKIFIKGSHDKWMRGNDYPYLREIALPDKYKDRQHMSYPRLLVLCHYPMRSWNMSHYAAWHLFGHHHGKMPPYGLSFDIGVDCHDFYPVSMDEIAEKMSQLKPLEDYRK